MASESRRLSILTAQEVDDLYDLPRFSRDDRDLYFDLSPAERELIDGVFTLSVAIHLVLQLGYFKAKRQFFVYALDAVTEDAGHILRRYFPARDMAEIKSPAKSTRLEQQQVILRLFEYRPCDAAAKAELERKARRVAMLSAQPVFILREVLQYLAHQRIVAPGYTYLQDMVGRTVSGERLRITRLLGRALTPEVERQLEALLDAEEGMYRISLLKHEPKDFSYGELRQEVERRRFFQPLFEFGQTFLASAGLSNESVKYYASLVQFYTVYKLQRMAGPTVRLYLLCFASHRFRQINDNLIEAFIHLVDQYGVRVAIGRKTGVSHGDNYGNRTDSGMATIHEKMGHFALGLNPTSLSSVPSGMEDSNSSYCAWRTSVHETGLLSALAFARTNKSEPLISKHLEPRPLEQNRTISFYQGRAANLFPERQGYFAIRSAQTSSRDQCPGSLWICHP